MEIISIRCEEEDVDIEQNALSFLVEIGCKTTLRYALHLIQPSFVCAKRRKSSQINVEDIKRVYSLFVDVQRSVQFLNDYQNQFVFHDESKHEKKEEKELEQEDEDDDDDQDILDIE